MVIGECMMEIRGDLHAEQLRHGFAGDTYNAGVYAARWTQELSVSFLTSVGKDCVSDTMLEAWRQEGVDCSLVLKSDTTIPGVYLIHTDSKGERDFVYWRKGSAATQLAELLRCSGGADSLPDVDCIFFSGISLGILCDRDRGYLLDVLTELHRRGATIACDPNYRAALWGTVEQAREWMTRAYSIADVALPGLEDHEVLFGHHQREQVIEQLQELGVGEIVVKCGADGVFAIGRDGETAHQPYIPAPVQVDSTGAGDSFAGTYLASRLSGSDLSISIRAASEVAKCVVQHRGAIIPLDVYRSSFS
tara:strand:+ start:1098 stop:2015 length:918 start_codon:yes stop_codon:yes gene_type:complete